MIIGHPQKGSFNHAIAETAKETLEKSGHETILHDLYEENFDPILPPDQIAKGSKLDPAIQEHCDQIAKADGIIIVHPNWWGQPPAILKGWIDRVLCQGIAYDFVSNDKGEGAPVGLFKEKIAIVFTTANTPDEIEKSVYGDPLEGLWKKSVFDFCGVPTIIRKSYSSIVMSTPEQRKQWLEDVKKTIKEHF